MAPLFLKRQLVADPEAPPSTATNPSKHPRLSEPQRPSPVLGGSDPRDDDSAPPESESAPASLETETTEARVQPLTEPSERSGDPPEEPRDVVEACVQLVGYSRKETKHAKASLRVGARLALRREPSNRYDGNAIAVHLGNADGARCGYVMAVQAARLAPALDDDEIDVLSATLERECPEKGAKPLPVRLRLRLSRGGARADAALELLRMPFDPPEDLGRLHAGAAAFSGRDDPTQRWVTHLEGVSPVAFAAARPPTKQSADRCWVYVHGDEVRYVGTRKPAEDGNFTGKWMLMKVPPENLDRWFVEAAKAVEAHEFTGAKSNAGETIEPGVIICYTNDFRDREDVTRSGRALKARFGTGVELKYKTDSSTLAGQYAGERKKTCVYTMKRGSVDLEVEEEVLREAMDLAKGGPGREAAPTTALNMPDRDIMAAAAERRLGARMDPPTHPGTVEMPIELSDDDE